MFHKPSHFLIGTACVLIILLVLAFTGLLVQLVTGSLLWGVVAAVMATIPFAWVFIRARIEQEELDDYYQSL